MSGTLWSLVGTRAWVDDVQTRIRLRGIVVRAVHRMSVPHAQPEGPGSGERAQPATPPVMAFGRVPGSGGPAHILRLINVSQTSQIFLVALNNVFRYIM